MSNMSVVEGGQVLMQWTQRKPSCTHGGRAAVISTARLPSQKAYAVAMHHLVDALGRNGIHVEVWAPSSSEMSGVLVPSETLGGPLWRWGRRLQVGRHASRFGNVLCRLAVALEARQQLGRERFGLIWARDSWVVLLAARRSKAVVLEVHHFPTWVAVVELWLAIRLWRKRLVLVAISPPIGRRLRRLGADGATVLVEPSAAPSKLFALEVRPLRSPATVAYVGRARSYGVDKGLQDLIDLAVEWSQVPTSRRPALTIRIVGLSDQEKAVIEQQVSRLELGASRIQLEASLPPSAVIGVLDNADILCAPFPDNPHFKGASPLKLAEYAAAGKAILATRTFPVLNVLPEDCFFSYESGNIDSMMSSLESIFADRDEALRRGARAREYAHEHTWEARTKRVLSAVANSTR